MTALRYRGLGRWFDERNWKAQAVDNSGTSEEFSSEEAEAYDSEDKESATDCEDDFDNIY